MKFLMRVTGMGIRAKQLLSNPQFAVVQKYAFRHQCNMGGKADENTPSVAKPRNLIQFWGHFTMTFIRTPKIVLMIL